MTTSARAARIAAVAFALYVLLPSLRAAAQEPENKSAPRPPQDIQTFTLRNITSSNDFNDITTDLRNVLPSVKIYGIFSQQLITMRATSEELQQAQKLIADLDRPKKVYRVTFTISENENGRKTGTQHYALTVTGDNKSWLKQGDRIPIITGSFNTRDNSNPNTQIQYLDVGINIEAAVSGAGLRAKIEQSSVSDQKSSVGIQDPIVRQTTVEAESTFVAGKPIAIGSVDIPGTTRHQEIEAVVEPAQ